MSLHAYALTTQKSAKKFMRKEVEGEVDLQLLDALINSATDFMELYCKRRFLKTTYTAELYDGNGTSMLFLRNFPIITVTTIHWTYPNVTDDLVDSTYYKVYNAAGYIYRAGKWIKGYQNVKVTYEAGYDFVANGIPPELEDICNALVNLKYNQPDRQGIKSEKMGGYAVSYSEDAMPQDIKLRLFLWRKIDVF